MIQRWVFTEAELAKPEICRWSDAFIATVSTESCDIDIIVYRNGSVSNRFGDGTDGVTPDLVELAEDVETYYDPFNQCYADIWRDVILDAEGKFLGWSLGPLA